MAQNDMLKILLQNDKILKQAVTKEVTPMASITIPYTSLTFSGLTVGAVFRATGATSAAFGQVDLADTDAVTGILAAARLGASPTASKLLFGDNTWSVLVEADIPNHAYTKLTFSGLTAGAVFRATSATAASFGQLDLADPDAVTGILPSDHGGTGVNVSTFYATGTFTPAYHGTGTAGTWVYSTQAGFYTRIGDRCFFNLNVAVSSRSVAPTGTAQITGLPFTSAATANSHSAISIDTIDAYTLSATNTQLTGRVPIGSAFIELIEVLGTAPTSAAALAATGFGTASFIRCSGHYMI